MNYRIIVREVFGKKVYYAQRACKFLGLTYDWETLFIDEHGLVFLFEGEGGTQCHSIEEAHSLIERFKIKNQKVVWKGN